MLARTLFASTLRRTRCNTKPQRGVTMVASRFNGWYKADRKKRAFRYATSNPCRVPRARYPLTSSLPAIEMAGRSTLVASYLKNHCLMPTASHAKLEYSNSSFANMPTSCNAKPQRGVTMVASRFNGWYIADRKKRAFRYATLNPCRVPTARYPSTSLLPAIEMAGYHCLMPTASLATIV